MAEPIALLAGVLFGAGLMLRAIGRNVPSILVTALLWVLLALAAVQYGPALIRALIGHLFGVEA